jgi:PleD family two-component response regulator
LSVRLADIQLSVSIGIAENDGLGIQEIIKMADDHLYKKKNAMKKGE